MIDPQSFLLGGLFGASAVTAVVFIWALGEAAKQGDEACDPAQLSLEDDLHELAEQHDRWRVN